MANGHIDLWVRRFPLSSLLLEVYHLNLLVTFPPICHYQNRLPPLNTSPYSVPNTISTKISMSTPTTPLSTATLYKLYDPEKGPPDSTDHSSVFRAMYTSNEGEFKSGTARYNPLHRGFDFTVDKSDERIPVKELVNRADTRTMLPTTEGFLFLFGKPFTLAEDADRSYESRHSGQPLTADAWNQDWDTGEDSEPELLYSDDEGSDDGDSDEAEEDVRTFREEHSVGWQRYRLYIHDLLVHPCCPKCTCT